MTRPMPLVVLLLVSGVCGAAFAQTSSEEWATALNDAYRNRYNNDTHEASIALCERALANEKLGKTLRVKAYDTLYEIRGRHRAYKQMVDISLAQRKEYPDDPAIDTKTAFRIADGYWRWGKEDDRAIADLEQYIARHPDDSETRVEAHLRIINFHERQKRFERVWQHGQKVLDLKSTNPRSSWSAIWKMQNAADQLKDYNRRLQVINRMSDPQFADLMTDRYTQRVHDVQADAYLKLDRRGDYDALSRRLIKDYAEPALRAQWAKRLADSLFEQKKLDEALAAYEKVFVDHPLDTAQWYSSQLRIVETLTALDRKAEALSAARVLFDATADPRSIAYRINQVMDLMEAIDGKFDRADQFYAFQKFGPAGEDGKPNTADDPTDPLRRVAYPAYADRKRAFAEARKQLGDNADAEAHRALTYVYCGQTDQAIGHLVRAMRYCQADAATDHISRLVCIGLRYQQGHTVGLDQAMRYAALGPQGQDNQPNTEDDLPDPFGAIADRTAPTVASQAEREALLRLSAQLQALVRQPDDVKRHTLAVRAIDRIQVTEPGDRESLIRFALDRLWTTQDRNLTAALLALGQTAAKSGALHMGGVRQFRVRVKTEAAEGGHTVEGYANGRAYRSQDYIQTRLISRMDFIPRARR